MNEVVFSIDSEGTVRSLVSEHDIPVSGTVKRASHVEPVNGFLRILFHTLRFTFGEYGKVGEYTRKWPVLWRVNLSPVNGPILLYEVYDRNLAIGLEVDWLKENWL